MFANGMRETTASFSDCDVWLPHQLDLFSPMSLTTLIWSSRGGGSGVCKTLVAVSGFLVVGQKAFATMKKPIPYSRNRGRGTKADTLTKDGRRGATAGWGGALPRFDRNGDGNISGDELFDAMRDLGHQISE